MNVMEKYKLLFMKDQYEEDILNELVTREWFFSKVNRSKFHYYYFHY
jgi:hypothetical protein